MSLAFSNLVVLVTGQLIMESLIQPAMPGSLVLTSSGGLNSKKHLGNTFLKIGSRGCREFLYQFISCDFPAGILSSLDFSVSYLEKNRVPLSRTCEVGKHKQQFSNFGPYLAWVVYNRL